VQWLEGLAPQGRWSAFHTLAGRSDEWVTALVASHLQSVQPRSANLQAARRFLLGRQQRSGGWAFGDGLPADADSTAWALSALRSWRGAPRAAINRAERFLNTHFTGAGFATYTPDSGIREYVRAAQDQSTEGWTSAHPDVTAAVLAARSRGDAFSREVLATLISTQTAAGLIDAYWWRSPFYSLALALRALRVHRRRPTRTFVDRATEVLDGKQLPEGGHGLGANSSLDAFTSALALEAFSHLASYTRISAAARAARALCAAQRENGSWAGDFVLRIPAPSVVNPRAVHGWAIGGRGGNAWVKDEQGIFATALACHALDLHRRVIEGTYAGLGRSWPELESPPARHDVNVAIVAPEIPAERERCNAPLPASSR
jgi:squalene cyclase